MTSKDLKFSVESVLHSGGIYNFQQQEILIDFIRLQGEMLVINFDVERFDNYVDKLKNSSTKILKNNEY